MTRRISVFALVAIAFASVSNSPSFAEPCLEWSLGEKDSSGANVNFNQDNQWAGWFVLEQNGEVLTGRATTWLVQGDSRDIDGIARGTLKGSNLQLRVNWNNGSVGMYQGKIDENGAINGATWDKAKPNIQVRWVSTDRSRSTCISYAKAPDVKPPDAISETSKRGIDLTDGVLLPGSKRAPDPAPPPTQIATANQDTDIYSGPDGSFDRLGVLDKGEKVQILSKQNGWTQIKYYYPPTNNAVWVWGEHLT